jgi:hypothetical protein
MTIENETVNAALLQLHEVFSVTATDEAGTFLLDIDVTDVKGQRSRCEYVSRQSDTFGLNVTIRKWLEENPKFPVQPYTPPTPEELRDAVPSLTARQLRLGLVNKGITPSQVVAALELLPSGRAKDTALIEWEYATTFQRTHALVALIGAVLGLTGEQIDKMWNSALSL